VSTLLGNYWLAFFGEFSVWTIGGVVIAYAGYNYLLFGYLHFIAHRGRSAVDTLAPLTVERAHRGTAMRPLWIAVASTGYEYLKSVGFLGYPWGLVAYPLATLNSVAQIAEMGGVWALSFLAAYINSSVAELFYTRETRSATPGTGSFRRSLTHRTTLLAPRHLLAAVLLVVSAGAFGTWRVSTLQPVENLDLLLVQQNIDSWRPGGFPDALMQAQELTLSRLRDLDSADSVDAVVWSETALRRPYTGASNYYSQTPAVMPFVAFLDRMNVPLITGAPMPAGADGRDAANSALVISPEGVLLGSYAKQQLVPFAERIPLWHLSWVRRFFREVVGLQGTWVPGAQSNPLPLPLADGRRIPIGTPICFEDAFGWVPRRMARSGARLLINLTNNSWSRQESAQTQHFAAARLRTIELRTTLVRSTNSGLSTVVDARGVATQSLPMFSATARSVTVPLYPEMWTLYRALGDWLGILAAAGAILRVIWLAIRRDRG
jgi:apolipoprotein N-acyltransferase